MLAKLCLEKETFKGKKVLRLNAFENVIPYNELPVDYMRGVPRFSASEYVGVPASFPAIIIVIPSNAVLPAHLIDHCNGTELFLKRIHIGDLFYEEDVTHITTWMRRAGNRLTKINRRLKEENEGWEGQVEITI